MLELIELLLHIIDVVLLSSAADGDTTLASILNASAHFHAVSVLHLLQEVRHLGLIDSRGIDIVKCTVHLLGFHVEILEYSFELANVLSDLNRDYD